MFRVPLVFVGHLYGEDVMPSDLSLRRSWVAGSLVTGLLVTLLALPSEGVPWWTWAPLLTVYAPIVGAVVWTWVFVSGYFLTNFFLAFAGIVFEDAP